MNKIMFCGGVELGKFLGSIDVIQDAYQAISELTLAYELRTSRFGNKILAFNCSSEYTTRFLKGEFDLIPSERLQAINFISTKVNSNFLINKAAVELFHHIGDYLKELEKKHINTSLIITGAGLGGYLAILSTLRLQQAIDEKESIWFRNIKRLICITFGSPIIGDATLQGAIAERPHWNLSFTNVVAKNDPVASFFSSSTPYKPFGIFLFCTESGGHTAFEDPDSILLVLDAMKLWNVGNLQIYDYTNVLSLIKRKVLHRGISDMNEFNLNLLRAGITFQLKEVCLLDDITEDEIAFMEMKQKKKIKINNTMNSYAPTTKLNDTKISLTYIEWYIKSSKSKGGYYDSYKNALTRSEITIQIEILKHQHSLNMYWKKIVEEKNLMLHKEGAKLRHRWLVSGTTYRRIVEPLDIAQHYKNGNINYMEDRSDHYKLLEKWLDSNSSEVIRYKPASLTIDSCFWAHVEEALISLRDIVNGGPANIEQKLEEFEVYVLSAITSYSVSPDIFLEGSSFMKWWNEYTAYKGNGYASEFAQYMNSERYMLY